jgi:tripeptide aminopeptidase
MTVVKLLQNTDHSPIEVMFNADEKIWWGTEYFLNDKINSKAAYTIDGRDLSELEVECFHAKVWNIQFKGKKLIQVM